jgi:chromosome segregation ATPase
MKSFKFLAVIAILALTTVSCVEKSGKYKTLLASRDSLQTRAQTLETSYNETLDILNEIEAGFAAIRESEGKIMVDMSASEGQSATKKQKLTSQLNQIKDILAQNKTRIAQLQSKLAKSGKENSALAENIKRMESELADKTAFIASLQDELGKKNITIDKLTNDVKNLNTNVSQLTDQSNRQQATIKDQDINLNTVWYIIATSKELKASAILSGNGLFRARTVLDKEFDKTLFTKADLRQVAELETGSKKAKVLSAHPLDSYSIVKGDDGLVKIVINDKVKFWSVSKYLVVQK